MARFSINRRLIEVERPRALWMTMRQRRRLRATLGAQPSQGRNFLVSFHPLCSTPHGRAAIDKFGLPAFSDGSCRREPDFESRYPSISALCRAGKFAPRLRKGDRVIYMTVKGEYRGRRGWALVAALEVICVRPSHAAAAAWYSARKLRLPYNCMVKGNPSLPVEKTTGLPASGAGMQQAWNQNGRPPDSLAAWNAHYQARATAYPSFVITKAIELRLNDPPVYEAGTLSGAFANGRVPVTQSYKLLSAREFGRVLALLRGR